MFFKLFLLLFLTSSFLCILHSLCTQTSMRPMCFRDTNAQASVVAPRRSWTLNGPFSFCFDLSLSIAEATSFFGVVSSHQYIHANTWCLQDRPGWHQLRMGARPPLVASSEQGEWQQGWQYHASSPLEHHFRETVILAKSCAADQADLRSRALVLERLRLPLPVMEAFCECGSPPGCVGQAQGCLPKVRSVAGQGCRSRAVPGPC